MSASGCNTNGACPPPASTPWQLAHSSENVASYALLDVFANSRAPRAIDSFRNVEFALASRVGSTRK